MIAMPMAGTGALADAIRPSWEQRPVVEAFSQGKTLSLALTLRIGRQPLLIRYSLERGLPMWFDEVRHSIEERCTDLPGWDGYSALPTNRALVEKLLNCLDTVMPGDGSPPVITPLADGGVQAEWHKNESVLELVVPSAEPARYYYYDPHTGTEEEGEFEDNEGAIARLIAGF